ncbi:uncharacterized protein LOC126816898 [Patella vulgata]|uniref:uncharacterized protein LOC126816898 n=1 Tax=Patella vulgata TaxID=6465 RepID=UPI002180000D|nr:uncharacterized protein LOC126816898 [Patella vulgata]
MENENKMVIDELNPSNRKPSCDKIDTCTLENSNDSSKENTTPKQVSLNGNADSCVKMEAKSEKQTFNTTIESKGCDDDLDNLIKDSNNSSKPGEIHNPCDTSVSDNKHTPDSLSVDVNLSVSQHENCNEDVEINKLTTDKSLHGEKIRVCNVKTNDQSKALSSSVEEEILIELPTADNSVQSDLEDKKEQVPDKLLENKWHTAQKLEKEKIQSIEKVMDEHGDEFIITMNDSDDSGEETTSQSEQNTKQETVKLDRQRIDATMPLAKQIYDPIKEKSVTNPHNLGNVSINLPPLPPLPQVQQLPLLLPNTNQKNKSLPLVNLYIPSSLVNSTTNIVTSKQIKTVKAPNVTVVPALTGQQYTCSNSLDLKQRLNTVHQTSNSRSLLTNSSISKPQITTILNQKSGVASPQSSKEMMSLIRWEITNRVYHRPKFQQLQPDSELGPLAKLLFDLGNDLVRETVYNDLVRIQTYRKAAGKLSDKESEDLNKLKDVQAELKDLVGPIKQNLKKKCSCGFRTESSNVLYNHQEYPHWNDNDLTCAICPDYTTRQPAAFIYHMEVMHNMRGRLEDKQPFWTCNLCPYENNSKSKLTQHRFRCLKNFNLKTNLSQNSIIGMEVNFCLENILYKRKETIKPRLPAQITPVTNSRPQLNIAPKPRIGALQQASVRHMGSGSQIVTFNNRPNLSNKINTLIDKNNQLLLQTKTPADNSGFEVCEICGGYVKDRKALRIHFYYAHRIEIPVGVFDRTQAPLYCATCFARFWTAQGLQKHLEVHKVNNPSSSAAKCIVCGHKVPNVLMHMRIVHNKELNSYLAACKCIFCGLICSSKRGVESHMVAGHGVMIKADSLVGQNAPKVPTSKQDTSRGSMCVLCNLHFSRNVDLTRHCMRVHHTCMKCGMVVADKISLDKHTCLKSGRGLRNCELCDEKGFHPAYHVKHIRDRHIKKCTVNVVKVSEILRRAALNGVNVHNSHHEADLKIASSIRSKIVSIKQVETIEIISDDENSPKKISGMKRSPEEIEYIDTDSDSPEEVVNNADKAYRPSITKKKCIEENSVLKDFKDGSVLRPSRRRSSTSTDLKSSTEQVKVQDSMADRTVNTENKVEEGEESIKSVKRQADELGDGPEAKKEKLDINHYAEYSNLLPEEKLDNGLAVDKTV